MKAENFISEKIADSLLWKNAEVFHQLFHNAEDAIVLCELTEDGDLSHFIEVNEAACRLLGYTRNDFFVLSPWDLLAGEEENASGMLAAFLERGNIKFRASLLSKEGLAIPFEIHAHNIAINEKTVVMAIARDISERQKAEEALRESEERYRCLVELSPNSIIVHKEGKLVFANTTAAKLLGVEKTEDLYGKLALSCVHPDDRELVAERIRQNLEENKVTLLKEIKLLRDDGTVIEADATASPFSYQGQPTVLVIARDITERKMLDEELLKISKLESIGTLAGSLAHDFNNILTVVLGNLSIAKMYAKDSDRISTKLREAETAALQAKDLTQRLLTFSRGGQPVKKTVSIPKMLKDAAELALRLSGVQCQTAFSDGLLPAEVDEGQVSQVFGILLNNAVEVMPQGGTVWLEAENITVNAQHNSQLPLETGTYVKVTVRDEGPGISRENMAKIFEPFFSTKPEASGLGLATAYSIVKKHNGYITVESVEGEGASFTVYLPAAVSVEKSRQETSRLYTGSGKILVMDDEEPVRKAAGEMLSLLGYVAVFASDGKEALALYKRARESMDPINAVIMDLTITDDMGGKEAITELLKIDQQARAIVSSGYSNDPVMSDYTAYGFKGVVAKPYGIRELSEVLYNLLN